MRRQQRHKTDPEYSPENHDMPFGVSTWAASRAPLCRVLSCFFKFETNWPFLMPGSTQACRERFASIQKRCVFESDVLKIFAKFESPLSGDPPTGWTGVEKL
jgi:hypothetical protein